MAFGHGGMESGGVGRVSIGGAIAYRRLPSDIPTGMKKDKSRKKNCIRYQNAKHVSGSHWA
ncbi:MAG: hypothetical protein Rhob2KO_50790 [Rhodopirellula baltica]